MDKEVGRWETFAPQHVLVQATDTELTKPRAGPCRGEGAAEGPALLSEPAFHSLGDILAQPQVCLKVQPSATAAWINRNL